MADASAMRPLRVVHLTTVSDSLNLLLACELDTVRAAGAEVIGMSGAGSPGQAPPDVLLDALTRNMDLRADVRMVPELFRELRRLRPDVVHTHTPKAGLYGRVVARLARVPIVVNTCHGLIVPPTAARWKRAVLACLEGIAALFSDAELYQSADDRRRLARVVRASRSRVVGNGTDLSRFRHDPERRASTRAAMGVDDDTIVVLGVGRRVRDKGIAEFCEAAAAVERPGVVFWWAGGAEPDKADAIDIHDSAVRALGHVDDMPSLYMAADIFVLPSYREGFPRSAMEAAATGVPLVLSDIPGCRQLGDDVAVFVRPKDAAALSDALTELLDDPQRRIGLSHAARRRAAEAFDQRRVAAASLDTYRAVATRKRRIEPSRVPTVVLGSQSELPARFT